MLFVKLAFSFQRYRLEARNPNESSAHSISVYRGHGRVDQFSNNSHFTLPLNQYSLKKHNFLFISIRMKEIVPICVNASTKQCDDTSARVNWLIF